MAVADELERALGLVASDHDQVLIGLQRCEFIDSTALAVIVDAYKEMAADGRRLSVYGPTSQVHRILSVTGLIENGLVFESREQALSEPG